MRLATATTPEALPEMIGMKYAKVTSLTTRAKRWTFTLMNWTQEGYSMIAKLTDGPISYLVLGKETAPTTGTPHLQGYLELTKRMSLSSLVRILPSGTRLFASGGTGQQNLDYCSKDNDFEVWGNMMKQGKRSDLDDIKEMIHDGASEQELADANFGSWLRYNQGFKRYRHMINEVKRDWFPEIYIHWGTTGLGKTRKVFDDNDDNDIWTWNGNHQFYQGYDLQPVALFDDFYGEINLGYILKLCDRYPLIVNIKNGECNWQPRKIYFTSNEDPRTWWPEDGQAKRDAFFRRVRENGGITHFDEL